MNMGLLYNGFIESHLQQTWTLYMSYLLVNCMATKITSAEVATVQYCTTYWVKVIT